MTKIFWKPAQKKAIAEAAFEYRQDPGFLGSDLDCVRQAMLDVIPDPTQHRNVHTMTTLPWVTDVWKDLTETLKNGYDHRAIKPVVSPTIERDATQLKVADITTESLWAELGKRLFQQYSPENMRALIRAETNATIDRRMPGIIPPDTLDANHQQEFPKERKPKLCIIGLMGAQVNMLTAEYGKVIDLHFLEGGEGTKRIKNTCSLMDLTIKSKWCKGLLGSTKDFENFQATTGGLDTIRGMIQRKFNV
jgi:hypothetical protein